MKRILLGITIAGVVATAGAAVPAVMVLSPHVDHPRHADAVIVLSGDHGERLQLAKGLLAAGVAPTLVLAGEPDMDEDVRLCQGGQTFEVVCLRPNPDSTRAEARSTAQLASSRHWKAIVVVTTTTHVTRSRLLFNRCFHGSVKVVGAKLSFSGPVDRQVKAHEYLGFVYAEVWARGC